MPAFFSPGMMTASGRSSWAGTCSAVVPVRGPGRHRRRNRGRAGGVRICRRDPPDVPAHALIRPRALILGYQPPLPPPDEGDEAGVMDDEVGVMDEDDMDEDEDMDDMIVKTCHTSPIPLPFASPGAWSPA